MDDEQRGGLLDHEAVALLGSFFVARICASSNGEISSSRPWASGCSQVRLIRMRPMPRAGHHTTDCVPPQQDLEAILFDWGVKSANDRDTPVP